MRTECLVVLFCICIAACAGSAATASEDDSPSIVVQQFQSALSARDYAAASQLFCSAFRQVHAKDLASGSLFSSEGKSMVSLLVDPWAAITQESVRGDCAWVKISVGDDTDDLSSQAGAAVLELIREAGKWKILQFPPSRSSSDALLAAKDGDAAGRWFLSMVRDGDFSKEEQEQIEAVLPGYYGSRIHWRKPEASVTYIYRGDYAYTTAKALKELAEYFPQKRALKPDRIEFWANPSAKVKAAAATRARDAAKRIAAKVMALKCTAYPELDTFDLKSTDLKNGSF